MHRSSAPAHRRVRPVLPSAALAVAAGLSGPAAWAQEPPPLRDSSQLAPTISPTLRPQLPTFVEGDRISGQAELETSVEGNASLRRGDVLIRADRIDYRQPDDLARARGNVRINRAGDLFEGPQLELHVEAFEGFFNAPRFQLLKNGAWGQASRIDFLDPRRAVVRDASYTTCQRTPGVGWLPDWVLTADTIRLDDETETGVATGASLKFFGVPILPVPALSFPLTDKRKSGLLPPTLAVDNISGITVIQPYYWNIAPNRDLTFSPTLMSKRGVDLGGEFRYLEPDYRGRLRANLLPGDNLRQRDRWSYSWQHADQLMRSPLPRGTTLGLNLNRASDDNYWRDFTRADIGLAQRLLLNEASLSWSREAWFVQARTVAWQTLQDPTAPIVPPYDRLPQLLGRYARVLDGGVVGQVEADFTRFQSRPLLTGQPNGDRSYLMATLSRNWQAPGWFLRPRLRLDATQYQLDSPLADGRSSARRVLPTASLDSGLVFERDTRLFGGEVLQTLEPRAFYVYTPYRDQSGLPVYDTAALDFNWATIFSDNAFSGHDRIADSNLLTLGLSSRFLDAGSGAQLARLSVAQRLRFKDQNVTLPGGTPVTDRLSDLILSGSVSWMQPWIADATVQYNPKTQRSERATLSARYNPSNYRVVSAAYRVQRDVSEQVDIGWQWPLNDLWGDRGTDQGPGRGLGGGQWYSVGRLNYSLRDRRPVDTVLGVEYDGCCWVGRVVLERLQAGVTQANSRILFQLEFVGFARLGTNALGALRNNIPRYQFLRDQLAPPSRFTSYD